jgi:hypothetical protein
LVPGNVSQTGIEQAQTIQLIYAPNEYIILGRQPDAPWSMIL